MTLDVYVEARRAGTLKSDADGHVSFIYDHDYRHDATSTPLSLSMPKHRSVHDGPAAARWIDNLLPDNSVVRDNIAAKFGERSPAAYRLLHHIGRDVAGAVQFVPSGDSLTAFEGLAPWSRERIAQEIDELHQDASYVDLDTQVGRWSLAGHFGKFALARQGAGWMEPRGNAPSTHIFKVGMTGLAGSDIAEFVTMRAAAALGITTAAVSIEAFDGRLAVIVERFDRQLIDGGVHRVHQEDLCQALAIGRSLKYELDGGPSFRTVSSVFTRSVPPTARAITREQFALLQAFNVLVAGTDGHAKNHSILLRGNQVRLAPAYDLISAALCGPPDHAYNKGKLSFRFGGAYHLRSLPPRRVSDAAGSLQVSPEWLRDQFVHLGSRVGQELATAIGHVREVIGDSETLDVIAARAGAVGARAHSVADSMRQRPLPSGRAPAPERDALAARTGVGAAAGVICGTYIPRTRSQCTLPEGHAGWPARGHRSRDPEKPPRG